MSPPRVFLSYAWESDDHRAWVRSLGSKLRADGVDARLDEWLVVPGDQLPSFMEREIREANFVLAICTPTYKEKSDARSGGVGYEGAIITAELFTMANERKVIPVLQQGSWVKAAPSWALGKFFLDFTGTNFPEQGYRRLLEALHGRIQWGPPVGNDPYHIWFEALKQMIRERKLINAITHYQRMTGCDVYQARDAVEPIWKEIHASQNSG
jgi:hypothetical protein